MSSHSPNRSRTFLAAVCGIGLAVSLLASRAQADMWNKMTYFTVNKTVQVQDTVLPAGTYVFKLMDSPANRHIVQIFNRDQTHLINTVLAIPNYRLQPTGHSRFLFYETPPGYAPALHAWFYPGDNFGQEFTYPKNLTVIQTVAQTQSSQMKNETTTEENKTTESYAERQAPAPSTEQEQTMKEETTPEQQPTEMAQNTPPPAPAPETQPAPQTNERPRRLPKTASPFPLFGLGGGLSLVMYGLLRLKRTA